MASERLAAMIADELSPFLAEQTRFHALREDDRELSELVRQRAAEAVRAAPAALAASDVLLGALPWRWQAQPVDVRWEGGIRRVVDDPARVEFFERFRELPASSVAAVVTGLGFLLRRDRDSAIALIDEIGGRVVSAGPVPRSHLVPGSSTGQYLVVFVREDRQVPGPRSAAPSGAVPVR